ncbi:hypothetical protein [Cupriavidus malaysiensis]|uniref:YecA family protein n=1 Tax=Cupriavidus malaysiensis TaxID=367825 RepID=A0A1D9IGK9_9BURK|nr:hypothetical protein [Cupriavidus malaysiensis]AOZ11165.1 hypothetical protein BKK80_35005 [Cupriavidus malaysiensis]
MNDTNDSRLRVALQAGSIPMRRAPLLGPDFLGADDAERYAIYTEPQDAPGRAELLATLRAKLARDATTLPWTGEPMLGETLEDEDWSVGVAEEVSLSSDDLDEVVGQIVNYRLILTRDLDPIGFCTFAINLDDYGALFATLCEAWIEGPYRDAGLGLGFMQQMADAIYAAVAELDDRLAGGPALELDIAIGRELSTGTVESLLQACLEILGERFQSPELSGAPRLSSIRLGSLAIN